AQRLLQTTLYIFHRIGLAQSGATLPLFRKIGVVVAGGEYQRNTKFFQPFGQREHFEPRDIYIENCSIKGHALVHHLNCAVEPHCRADDPATQILKDHFKVHSDKRLVLDNENAKIVQRRSQRLITHPLCWQNSLPALVETSTSGPEKYPNSTSNEIEAESFRLDNNFISRQVRR